MKIAIIRAGKVGSTLGKGWMKQGTDIFFGIHYPQAGTVVEAAAFGEVVVLATLWQGKGS